MVDVIGGISGVIQIVAHTIQLTNRLIDTIDEFRKFPQDTQDRIRTINTTFTNLRAVLEAVSQYQIEVHPKQKKDIEHLLTLMRSNLESCQLKYNDLVEEYRVSRKGSFTRQMFRFHRSTTRINRHTKDIDRDINQLGLQQGSLSILIQLGTNRRIDILDPLPPNVSLDDPSSYDGLNIDALIRVPTSTSSSGVSSDEEHPISPTSSQLDESIGKGFVDDECLKYAVGKDDFPSVCKLIDSTFDISAQNAVASSAMLLACRLNKTKTIEGILFSMPLHLDLQLTDSEGLNILHNLIRNFKDHDKFVERLLNQPRADVNFPDENDHYSPLHYAVKFRKFGITKALLLKGANPNAEDRHHVTPLVYAIQNMDVEIIQTLVDNNATLGSNPCPPIKGPRKGEIDKILEPKFGRTPSRADSSAPHGSSVSTSGSSQLSINSTSSSATPPNRHAPVATARSWGPFKERL